MQMQSPAPSFEIPAEMRAFAERSFEQARIAFDKFMETAQSTMNTLEGQSKVAQAGAKEISQKIMGFAEQNVSTAFDYAQKLVQAKDPQSLMALHGEFVQAQMQVLAEQARELTEIASKTARDSAKPSP
jgi:phasin